MTNLTSEKIVTRKHLLYHRLKSVVLIVSLLFLIMLLYPVWLPWIGEFLVISEPLHKADALVILAGIENERIAAGAQLFKQGYADWFILTDMRLDIPDSQGVYSANVMRKAVDQGIPSERILIAPGQASTTDEEAILLRNFIATTGLHSLIIVTSPYHTLRAHLILHEAFRDSGVTFTVYPIPNENYRADVWWQNPFDRKQTLLEYTKILAHIIGCREFDDCGINKWAWLKPWLQEVPTQ